MRKLFIVILLMACLAGSAQNATVLSLPGNQVFKVFFKSPEPTEVRIELKSRGGRTLISQQMTSAAFVKPFNLTNLPEDQYTFFIAFNDEVVAREITVGTPKGWKDDLMGIENSERIMIAAVDENVEIQLMDESIETLSIFFYMVGSNDFECYLWKPSDIKKQTYSLSGFQADQIRVEVVAEGKVLARKKIAKHW